MAGMGSWFEDDVWPIASSESAVNYVEIALVAEFEAPSPDLPPFLGATLRGTLGYLLKRAVCQMAHGRCDRCLLQRACPYPAVFEGLPPSGRTMMRKYPAIPQPFVLLLPAPGEHWWEDGRLRWGVRLFGPAISYWPYVVHTFQLAGSTGIGRRRWHYRLIRVTDGLDGPVIWSADESESQQPTVRRIEQPTSDRIPERCALRWRFHTPVRVRKDGRSAAVSIDGLQLLLAGRRRYHILSHFYGDGVIAQPHREDRFERGDFLTRSTSLRKWGFSRYSGRQKRRMNLSGLIGEITIEGPWGRSGPWLPAVPLIHLGKATSFGFGRVEWEIV